MNKNKVIELRFINLAKHTLRLGIFMAIVFALLSAFNTGQPLIEIISYGVLAVALTCLVQSLVFKVVSIYYGGKRNG